MTQLQTSNTSTAPQASGPANTLRLTVSADAGNSSLLATIHPPSQPGSDGTPEKRAPVDLCCVIDVSGSMDDDAAVPSEQDKPLEVTGLSVMDVTKHAMRTIIASMGEDDRLALVSFTNRAKVVANLTQTNQRGKDSLLRAVEGLRPDNSTNLWDGLKVGMNTLNEQTGSGDFNTVNRVQSVFILTDGMPNVEPPRGHIPMLKQYLEANPQTRFNISTFGFGYSLDSKLLSEIANVGGGSYGFIPDAGMVGTVFVHALANLFATYAPRAIMNVEMPEGMTLKTLKGSYPNTSASWGSRIEIGDVQYGQTRQFILEFNGIQMSEVTVSVVAKPWFAQDNENLTVTATPVAEDGTPSEEYLLTKYRLDSVTYINQLCGQHQASVITTSNAAARWTTQATEIRQYLPTNADALDLATDMAGELNLAVSSQANWKKWGVHYYPSIARAHQREQCSNFKDAGLQVYGRNSPLFLKSRDAVDATFDNLPPPKPTKQVRTQAATSYSRGVNYQHVHSMQQYNMRSGPCMTGESPVMLADGTQIRTDAVKRGTIVDSPRGPRTVAAVIKTPLSYPVALCTLGELRITPWHPIMHEGAWKFPADVVQPEYGFTDAIYSFLLQPSADADAHAMNIGGVACVTYGHGIVFNEVGETDVRAHSFFGSYDKMLAAVASLPGFRDEDGVAQCGGVLRDANSLICGLVPLEQAETDHLSEKRAMEVMA